MLEKIVESLISTSYLPDISWTGKGKQKERKVALCRFNHLIDFVKATTFKADTHYTEAKFKDKLIYGILKRAPSKYGVGNNKENVSDTSEILQASNTAAKSPPIQQQHDSAIAQPFVQPPPIVQSASFVQSPPIVQSLPIGQSAMMPLPIAHPQQNQPYHPHPYYYNQLNYNPNDYGQSSTTYFNL